MRSRNIKPSVVEDDRLAELGPNASLLAERLPMLADREGRLEDRPRKIRALLFPYWPDIDVEPLLAGLEAIGRLRRYDVGGERYIQLLDFADSQRPHSNESASVVPACPDVQPRATALATMVDSAANQGDEHFALIPDSSLLIDDSGLIDADSTRETRADGAAAPPKPPKKRAMSMQSDWTPDETLLAWAVSEGFTEPEVQREAAKFVDHFLDSDKTARDWSPAFRNWLRRSREFASRASTSRAASVNGKPSAARRLAAMAVEMEGGAR